MHVCVKMVSKGSKEALTVLIVTHVTQVKRVESGVVALTQHCIQGNASYVERVKSVLCIQWPLVPARREGYCVSFPSWGISCSPLVSPRRQLC